MSHSNAHEEASRPGTAISAARYQTIQSDAGSPTMNGVDTRSFEVYQVPGSAMVERNDMASFDSRQLEARKGQGSSDLVEAEQYSCEAENTLSTMTYVHRVNTHSTQNLSEAFRFHSPQNQRLCWGGSSVEASHPESAKPLEHDRMVVGQRAVSCHDHFSQPSTDVPVFFHHGLDLPQYTSSSWLTQDTLPPRGLRGTTRPKETVSPGFFLPPITPTTTANEEDLAGSLSAPKWSSHSLSGQAGVHRGGGGGGGSQPSTTGSQGFPQYVTAGPDMSIFGHNMFGYDQDGLANGMVWA